VTSEPHAVLNASTASEARAALARCCGASRWVEGMLARRPFASTAALYADAEAVWGALGREDFLEAFAHHPRIGARAGDVASPVASPGADARAAAALQATAAWASQEQARVSEADAGTQQALRAANEAYLDRFGYIFIVCATGKSASEMLALLRARLPNEPAYELAVAAGEQARITRLRLAKLGVEAP
jgi:2-oxo-4-hydroxy-4-carboxy-5-ureidoimidazoline decarboxylase